MKKLISAILCFIIVLGTVSAFADDSMDKAKALYNLGIIKGTGPVFSESSLELNRNATRAEMCATVVRMLGKEAKANYQQNPHPFNDVPSWASNSIGWLYENYLVSGGSETYFGAMDIATVQQYSAMLLRVLGFYESKGDFSYNDATNFALNYGIVTSDMVYQYELSRKTMVIMSYNALKAKIKNSNRTLIRKLCDEGAINEIVAKNSGIMKEESISDAFADVPENLGKISVATRGNRFRIDFETPVEEYGLRVFVKEEGGLLKEVTLYTKDAYLEKGNVYYPGGGGTGYLDNLVITGLNTGKKYSFIVLKTSSESDLYLTYGKSMVANN